MHKVTLDIVPSSEMREALREVGVEVLGVKDSGVFIELVTDATTGYTNGKTLLKERHIITCERPLNVV